MSWISRSSRDRVLLAALALALAGACGSSEDDFFGGSRGGSGGAPEPVGGSGVGNSPTAGFAAGGRSEGGVGAMGSAGEQAAGSGAEPAGGSGGASDGGTSARGGAAGRGGMTSTAGKGGNANGGTAGRGGTGGTAGSSGSAGKGGSAGCVAQIELCDGFDNDCDSQIDERPTCEVGCEGGVLDGHGYMFCLDQERTFAMANARCAAEEMHLVWIESEAENAAILRAVEAADRGTALAWIGGSDRSMEGEWTWIRGAVDAGTPFWSGRSVEDGGMAVMGRYANWGLERPNTGAVGNEDCATINFDWLELEPGSWNDDVCSDLYAFICER